MFLAGLEGHVGLLLFSQLHAILALSNTRLAACARLTARSEPVAVSFRPMCACAEFLWSGMLPLFPRISAMFVVWRSNVLSSAEQRRSKVCALGAPAVSRIYNIAHQAALVVDDTVVVVVELGVTSSQQQSEGMSAGDTSRHGTDVCRNASAKVGALEPKLF